MLISTAQAQTAAPAAGAPPMSSGDAFMSFLPLILIFVIFYFLLIRPQQKRMKEHQTMLDALKKGDPVVTGGGILGTITKVGPDDEVTVEIAENVRIRVLKGTITGKEPTPEEKAKRALERKPAESKSSETKSPESKTESKTEPKKD